MASLSILVELLTADDEVLVDTAHRALVAITRQDFDLSHRKWQAWIDRHGQQHRIEWLMDALTHNDDAIRVAAGDELKELTQEYYGYHPAMPKRDREIAQGKYRKWWETDGRNRFSSRRR